MIIRALTAPTDPATRWVMVTAWATAALVVVALASAVIAIRTLKRDHARRRADETMRTLFRYLDQSRTCWVVIRQAAVAENVEKVELLRTTKGTPARVAHQHLLQELEMISTGCRLGVYSTRVVYDVAKNTINQLWDLSKPYVDAVREGKFDARLAQPTAYEYLEWLIGDFRRLDGKPVAAPKGSLDRHDR